MRNCVLHGLLLAFLILIARTADAQTALQLRWEFVDETNAAFILTNRDSKPLAASGWAIYFNALRHSNAASVGAEFEIQHLVADLHRIVPAPGFTGLVPGATIRIPYRTDRLLNRSFVPAGPYIVFEDAKDVGVPIRDYVAAPFEHSPGVVTPEARRDISPNDLPLVFPTPLETMKRAGVLRLTALPRITAPAELGPEAAFAAEYLRPMFRSPVQGRVPLTLEVGVVEGQTSPEAYELVIDRIAGIRIVGVTSAGVFYGLQSLRNLLQAPSSDGALSLPNVRVIDAPRYGYRGFMLDVARNFQPKPSVLRTIDLLARYKLNVLHLHLTDDEGWRIEIAGLPELTTVGARRGHTLDSKRFLPPAYGSGPLVDQPYGSGFFSRADYVEIVRYAAARHIEVIPEIEMPGHARAAIKAMEARSDRQYALSDPEDRSVYKSVQGYPDNVMNPALESTYRFIEHVVGDLAAMHREAGGPLRHVHMGGDEVPPGVWTGSPAVQSLMQAKGLTSTDDLWFVFYGRIEQILKGQGLLPSGWEEIALRKTTDAGRAVAMPNPDFAGRGWRAYVWNNVVGGGAEDLAYRLANGGYDVVLCPVTNYYFDLAWNRNAEERGLDWGGYVDVKKPFEFIPFDYYRNVRVDRRGNPLDPAVFAGKERLTDAGRSHIVGLQGNLWSETLGGDGRLEYMMVPKLFGLAERAWAREPDWSQERDAARADALFSEAWERFVNLVGKRELPRLDRELPGFNYRIPTPVLRVDGGQVYATIELPGFTLRYTIDGSAPTARSEVVRGPIPLRGTVSVAAFNSTGRAGQVARIPAPARVPQ
jgi:hexosaminidase